MRELSQVELAKLLNLSQSTIAYYELNRKEPSQNTLQRLADFFGVSVDYLLGRTDIPTTTTAREPRNPDIREIARAGDKFPPEKAKELRRIAEVLFPDAFKDQ